MIVFLVLLEHFSISTSPYLFTNKSMIFYTTIINKKLTYHKRLGSQVAKEGKNIIVRRAIINIIKNGSVALKNS